MAGTDMLGLRLLLGTWSPVCSLGIAIRGMVCRCK